MLVDEKFLYISLPRRGSTSFHYSCILNGISAQSINDRWNAHNSNINFLSIEESSIMDYIQHGHESLIDLYNNFGSNYPVIAVRRDRYESFYSLYKHILFDLKRAGADKIYEHFKNITIDELFFYKTEDLLTKSTRWNTICNYLLDKKLISNKYEIPMDLNLYSEEYIINVIDILITPSSFWHNNDPNVIWFDIKNLKPMEEWVSNITKKPFQLKKVNSSKHMETNLKLDSEFIKKYNNIYDYYDLPKSVKTLI